MIEADRRAPARALHPGLRAALMPNLGFSLAVGGGACSDVSDTRSDNSASQWRDYDTKMESWAGCLRANGMPDMTYSGHNTSPEELKQQRAMARCVREHGFPDYPDPDPNPDQNQAPSRYDDLKPGMLPELDKAFRDCEKQLGVPAPNGG